MPKKFVFAFVNQRPQFTTFSAKKRKTNNNCLYHQVLPICVVSLDFIAPIELNVSLSKTTAKTFSKNLISTLLETAANCCYQILTPDAKSAQIYHKALILRKKNDPKRDKNCDN